MYITHDYIEEIKCDICKEKQPYYAIKENNNLNLCEYCFEEKEQK